MEKPDEFGYVNVLWPSRNVPHGGIFHTRTIQPSSEQQQLLKVLQEESKLNMRLRQSRGFGLRSEEGAQMERAAESVAAVVVRPRTSRRRSLSAIRSSGILDVEIYRPVKRGEDRERMKERLANNMAFGDSTEQAPPVARLYQRKKKLSPKIPTAKETWNELVSQIRERAEWLAEMEWLGEAAPHREIMQEQIAERMRALDALGVDSACSTARSSAHSTARSTAHSSIDSVRASRSGQPRSAACMAKSPKADVPKKGKCPSANRPVKPEEHVMAYSQLSPLGYSPRRRV